MFGSRRRMRWPGQALLMALLAALVACGVLTAAASADEVAPPEESGAQVTIPLDTCIGDRYCLFTGEGFSGAEVNMACLGGAAEGRIGEFKSAKNNCPERSIRLGFEEGGSVNFKACLDTGGERPSIGRFNYYQVFVGEIC